MFRGQLRLRFLRSAANSVVEHLVERKNQPEAPWVKYPNTEPWWSGWRQGDSEQWLHESWFPFWRSLPPQDRRQFLERNPPPSDDWALYLDEYWS